MNITGIRPMEGFYTYNINKINELRNQQIEASKVVQPSPEAEVEQVQLQEAPKPEQNFSAYDYAQNYEPDAVYEMKGSESDIHNLDMEKAISDMQKDQLLQQYQFFVGSSRQMTESQSVVAVASQSFENFTL